MVKEFRNMKSPSRAMIFWNSQDGCKHPTCMLSNMLYLICQTILRNTKSTAKRSFQRSGFNTGNNKFGRTILDTAAKFKNKDTTVSTACAKALAIIGALDSNKFQFKTVKQLIIISLDFEDIEENSTFW